MIRNLFTVRGLVTAVLVLALISYIVNNPAAAGNNASDAINTFIGWGRGFISAVITFFQGLKS
jgi:hypothetical protein